jgi:hypothetical protein
VEEGLIQLGLGIDKDDYGQTPGVGSVGLSVQTATESLSSEDAKQYLLALEQEFEGEARKDLNSQTKSEFEISMVGPYSGIASTPETYNHDDFRRVQFGKGSGLLEDASSHVRSEGKAAAAAMLEDLQRKEEEKATLEKRVRFESSMRASEDRLLLTKQKLHDTQKILSGFLIDKLVSPDEIECKAAIEALEKLTQSLRGSSSAEDRRLLLHVYDAGQLAPPGWLLAASISDGLSIHDSTGIPIESWRAVLDFLPELLRNQAEALLNDKLPNAQSSDKDETQEGCQQEQGFNDNGNGDEHEVNVGGDEKQSLSEDDALFYQKLQVASGEKVRYFLHVS